MSMEMQERKKKGTLTAEEQAKLDADEAQLKEDMKDAKDDVCPHCLQPISSYPYVNFHPVFGWLECAACGIVYSPKSIRKVKVRKATTRIEAPSGILRPV